MQAHLSKKELRTKEARLFDGVIAEMKVLFEAVTFAGHSVRAHAVSCLAPTAVGVQETSEAAAGL